MSATSLEVFDTTLHKTNRWLHDLMHLLDRHDRQEAYLALRAVLHALRDQLTIDEVAQLAAQLPMLVRGFYYEGWDPSHTPLRERQRAQFLARIGHELRGVDLVDPESIACAVFTLLAMRVSEGEVDDVKHVVPAPIRELWPRA